MEHRAKFTNSSVLKAVFGVLGPISNPALLQAGYLALSGFPGSCSFKNQGVSMTHRPPWLFLLSFPRRSASLSLWSFSSSSQGLSGLPLEGLNASHSTERRFPLPEDQAGGVGQPLPLYTLTIQAPQTSYARLGRYLGSYLLKS